MLPTSLNDETALRRSFSGRVANSERISFSSQALLAKKNVFFALVSKPVIWSKYKDLRQAVMTASTMGPAWL